MVDEIGGSPIFQRWLQLVGDTLSKSFLPDQESVNVGNRGSVNEPTLPAMTLADPAELPPEPDRKAAQTKQASPSLIYGLPAPTASLQNHAHLTPLYAPASFLTITGVLPQVLEQILDREFAGTQDDQFSSSAQDTTDKKSPIKENEGSNNKVPREGLSRVNDRSIITALDLAKNSSLIQLQDASSSDEIADLQAPADLTERDSSKSFISTNQSGAASPGNAPHSERLVRTSSMGGNETDRLNDLSARDLQALRANETNDDRPVFEKNSDAIVGGQDGPLDNTTADQSQRLLGVLHNADARMGVDSRISDMALQIALIANAEMRKNWPVMSYIPFLERSKREKTPLDLEELALEDEEIIEKMAQRSKKLRGFLKKVSQKTLSKRLKKAMSFALSSYAAILDGIALEILETFVDGKDINSEETYRKINKA